MSLHVRTYLLLVTACMVLAGRLMAQVKYKTEYFTSEDGLSHRMVSAMFKDDDGFMWFGTWNGINRFDGKTFRSFKTSVVGSQRIHNDRIRQVVDDHKGFLWIITYDKYLYCFDKQKEAFIPVSDIINKSAGKKIQVHGISIITADRIWLITVNEGAFCLPLRNITPESIIQYSSRSHRNYTLDSNHIFFIHKDQDSNVWVGNTGGISKFSKQGSGIYKKDPLIETGKGRKNFTKVSENATCIYFTSHNGAAGVYIKKQKQLYLTSFPGETIASVLCSKFSDLVYMTTVSGKLIAAVYGGKGLTYTAKQTPYELGNMYEDTHGNLWAETVDAGVAVLQKENGLISYYSSSTHSKRTGGGRFSAFQDFNGTVWITYSNGELVYYDPSKDAMKPALQLDGLPGGIFFNSVYRTFYDSGVIWIGSEFRGITKLIIQRNIFGLEDFGTSGHFPDHEVRAVYFDRSGRRWASTQGGQLVVHRNGVKVPVTFNDRALKDFSIIAYTIIEDSRGSIWIGTKNDGLYKAVPTDTERMRYRLQHYPTVDDQEKGFRIYSILEDRSRNIWIGTYDAGLIRVTEKQGTCYFQKLQLNHPQYPENTFRQVRHLALDHQGLIWVATTGGLLTLKQQDGGNSGTYKVKIYRKQLRNDKGLPDNDVLFIAPDSKGRVWVTTAGGGLSLVTKNAWEALAFESFGIKEGLANDYVLSCVEDRLGNIWVATEGGLSCFRSQNKDLVNYDSYDGLPAMGFSEGTAAIDASGNLVFGTSQGLITFNPSHLQRALHPSGMLLTSLQVNNKLAFPGETTNKIDADVNYLKYLKLRYDQNTIAINYIIPDYRRKNHQYSFRLSGLDDKWSKDISGRAVFTNLRPGKYLFEVKGEGEDYSPNTYRKLSIIITPPFWKTGWAYAVYVILAITLIELIRRTITAMIRLRNKVVIEQQLSEMKLNFFTNISHELRTPLTLIVSPLEQLAKKENFSAQGQGYLEVITRNANRMVHFINQLLDFRKAQYDKLQLNCNYADLVQLSYDTAAHFKAEQLEKNISFRIIADHAAITAYLDGEKIATVIYNLLANAFKFTPNGKEIVLKITADEPDKKITIAVEDQGPGVKPGELKDIFEVFHSGIEKDSRQLKGIGIGLALSKELVALHNGQIEAFNNKWGGLTVQFVLTDTGITGTSNEIKKHENRNSVNPAGITAAYNNPPANNQKEEKPEQASARVLLVEDNEELRNFLSQQLSVHYKVITATNGLEGYTAAQQLLPDLIISDVMMPEMNGIEMLDQLKNNINTSHIPVVLLTARSSVESQVEGIRYGADFYITKPFNSELLFASINNLLQQRARWFRLLKNIPTDAAGNDPVPELAIGKDPEEPAIVTPAITLQDEAFLDEVIRVVEEKMGDYNFNIELVAGSMNMGRTTFYKKFKSLTGITPVEFVRDRRLDKAKNYLDSGIANVSEAAYNSGFNNPKYFSTCFKARFGVSPIDYLKDKK